MCSRKLLRENDNIMRPNYCRVRTSCAKHFVAYVNNVMTFSAYISADLQKLQQFNFELAPQTFGLVTSSNSLPEGQPCLFISVSPCCPLLTCFLQKPANPLTHNINTHTPHYLPACSDEGLMLKTSAVQTCCGA